MANTKKRRGNGEGTIRQKTITKNGKSYTYWEGRFITGINPGTGEYIRKTITGKTQKEVRQKMTEAVAALDKDDYVEPCKMTLGAWLDVWQSEYLGGVKPATVYNYEKNIRLYIKPAMGAIKLEALNPHTIQQFYNALGRERDGKPGLSPKSIKCVHGILHKALEQAKKVGYLRNNPSDVCEIPRVVRKEMQPLDLDDIARFMAAIKGHRYETVYLVTLFTGMREGEVMGLTWDCVDFERNSITVNKQLQLIPLSKGEYRVVPTKNSKGRVITAADDVIAMLREQKQIQDEWRERAGELWQDDGYVFTDELGGHLKTLTVYKNFKRIVASIGRPEVRFHDLRHSYALVAIRSGDDIKTVQGNLGHATAAFTLDVYGHYTDPMKRASANRMQKVIEGIKAGMDE